MENSAQLREIKVHLSRDQIESILSVPGIQGCHENTPFKSFQMSHNIICLYVSTNIPLGPAWIQTWSRGWPQGDLGANLCRDISSGGSFRSFWWGCSPGALGLQVQSSWIQSYFCSSVHDSWLETQGWVYFINLGVEHFFFLGQLIEHQIGCVSRELLPFPTKSCILFCNSNVILQFFKGSPCFHVRWCKSAIIVSGCWKKFRSIEEAHYSPQFSTSPLLPSLC